MESVQKIGIESLIDLLNWLDTCQLIIIVEENREIILSKIYEFFSSNRPGPKQKTNRPPEFSDERGSRGSSRRSVRSQPLSKTVGNDNERISSDNRARNRISYSTTNPVVVLHKLTDMICWNQVSSGKTIGDDTTANGGEINPKRIPVLLKSSFNSKISQEPLEVKVEEHNEFDNSDFEPIRDGTIDDDIESDLIKTTASVIPVTNDDPVNETEPEPIHPENEYTNTNIDNIPKAIAVDEMLLDRTEIMNSESQETISVSNSNFCTEMVHQIQDLPEKPENTQCPRKILRKTIGVGDMMINQVYEVDEGQEQQDLQDFTEEILNHAMDTLEPEITDIFDPIEAPDIAATTSPLTKEIGAPEPNFPEKAQKQKQTSFPCAICDKIFRNREQWRRHQMIHQNLRNFKCQVCGKAFYFKNQLTNHQLIHSGNKPHLCEKCPKSYVTLGLLQHHMNAIHLGVKPFPCTICDKRFAKNALLKSHMRSHSEERPFKCKFCEQALKTVGNLRQHELTHTKKKPCESSGKSCHKRRNHKN